MKSRRMRLAGHVAFMGERRGVYGVLVSKPEGKGPLGRPMRRWEDNIKMDLQEVWVWTGSKWLKIGSGGTCECENEPSVSMKFGEFLD